MTGYVRGQSNSQAPPGLSVFLPRLDLFRLDSFHRKEEGCVQVSPHRVAGEVGKLQAIPRCVDQMAPEGVARIRRSSTTCPPVVSIATRCGSNEVRRLGSVNGQWDAYSLRKSARTWT